MTDDAALLAAYDDQLRGEGEAAGAMRSSRSGPLVIAVYAGGYGLVTYRDLDGADEAGVRALVERADALLRDDPEIVAGEWKTRAHDDLPGLHDALVATGFTPAEPESIMIGAAGLLALELPLPDGVTVRRIEAEAHVRAASDMADEVFGDEPSAAHVAGLLDRIARGEELWVAEAGGRVVSTGRLNPVEGTDFAGIWGGATLPAWRRRGIYRALTAERARSAVRLGKRWINSDSTEYSRPILERAGLRKVSETTPYEWRR